MVPNVIIIDDDDVNNFLCKRIITLANFSNEISTFVTADSALSFLKLNLENEEALPEIIFLDINMPVKNGWDFLNEFQLFKGQLKKNIKIFMLSSSVYEEDMKKAESYSCVADYISKPLSVEILKKIEQQII